jgi:hypothetical protein
MDVDPMSGLRIHHAGGLTNCVLIVPHPGNTQGRKPKDYHVHIDNEGDAMVSETVWKRLEECRASGLSDHKFILMNTVLRPPTIGIGVNTDNGQVDQERKRVYKQINDVAQQFAPNGVVPRITRKDK